MWQSPPGRRLLPEDGPIAPTETINMPIRCTIARPPAQHLAEAQPVDGHQDRRGAQSQPMTPRPKTYCAMPLPSAAPSIGQVEVVRLTSMAAMRLSAYGSAPTACFRARRQSVERVLADSKARRFSSSALYGPTRFAAGATVTTSPSPPARSGRRFGVELGGSAMTTKPVARTNGTNRPVIDRKWPARGSPCPRPAASSSTGT